MNQTKSANVHPLDRTNLRLPAGTFSAIDDACAARPGNVSRNTWIAEAIAEKLAREILPEESDLQVKQASNG
tara:strand:- start:2514 stop:2729 length:216 start_codon:yes stop_codon:yes gene_type:complete